MIAFYDELYKKYGANNVKSLGWGSVYSQEKRFGIINDVLLRGAGVTVLDVGCGYGDLIKFVGWVDKYMGIDIRPEAITLCRLKYPYSAFKCADTMGFANGEYKYVVGSGLFCRNSDADKYEGLLSEMYRICSVAVIVNFLQKGDGEGEGVFYMTPQSVITSMLPAGCQRYEFVCGYLKNDFTVVFYK